LDKAEVVRAKSSSRAGFLEFDNASNGPHNLKNHPVLPDQHGKAGRTPSVNKADHNGSATPHGGRSSGDPQSPRILAQNQGRCPSHPCTFIGKHLRFSDDDIASIMKAGACQPITTRQRTARNSTS
jgi:hypothetical protein